MSKVKLVTPDFKPKQSRKSITERKLLDEIEELKEQLEEAIKRGDELFDELERYRENREEGIEVISSAEYDDLKECELLSEEFVSVTESLRIAKERLDLGVISAQDDIRDLLEQLGMIG